MSEQWIVVRNWERFQHYKDRTPLWIKNYPALILSDEYRGLSLAARGLLHGIWMLYAQSDGKLGASVEQLNSKLGASAKHHHLVSLIDAGFLEVRASEPLAHRYPREEKSRYPLPRGAGNGEIEILKDLSPRERGTNPRATGTNPRAQGTNPRELGRYTGCRWVRGSHGSSYVYDPLGTTKPPPDWPHEKPTKAEIQVALAIKGAS